MRDDARLIDMRCYDAFDRIRAITHAKLLLKLTSSCVCRRRISSRMLSCQERQAILDGAVHHHDGSPARIGWNNLDADRLWTDRCRQLLRYSLT